MDSPALASPDSSSPAKGLAAWTATAENTKNAMSASRKKLIGAAMISGSELYNAQVYCFNTLIADQRNQLYIGEEGILSAEVACVLCGRLGTFI